MSIVSGRVRPTVRLRQDEVDAVCVLATSWSSERAFPRTVGVGVPFEIETAGGEILRVDPFDAVVALPVRRYERAGGVSREYAWIGPDDEVTVEGDLDVGDASSSRQPPALHATRIASVLTGCARHHIPPRALRAGEIEPRAAAAPDERPPSESDAAPPAPQPLPRRKRKRIQTPNPGSGTPPSVQ
jgi:hypothetical protein